VEYEPAPPAAEYADYKVRLGDSLRRIAKRILGNELRYLEILQANGLTAKSVIFPGQVLKVPKQ
jgi:nucleoid-associated protein YgaU